MSSRIQRFDIFRISSRVLQKLTGITPLFNCRSVLTRTTLRLYEMASLEIDLRLFKVLIMVLLAMQCAEVCAIWTGKFPTGFTWAAFPGPEHEANADRQAQPSKCTQPLFHAPLPLLHPLPESTGYISKDGHHFDCVNPAALLQAFHM